MDIPHAKATPFFKCLIAATQRTKQQLIWFRYRDGVYGAEWKNICVLLLIHIHTTHELQVIDRSGFREPYMFIYKWSSEPMRDCFRALEHAIRCQMPGNGARGSRTATWHDFLRYIEKTLS